MVEEENQFTQTGSPLNSTHVPCSAWGNTTYAKWMYWIKTNPSLREKTRKFTFPFPQVLNWGVSISQQFLYIYIKFIPRKRKHSFVDGSILQAPQCHLGISFLWQLKKINIKNKCVWVCVCTACACLGPMEARRGQWTPCVWSYSCKPPHGCWNSDPTWELLTSLQPNFIKTKLLCLAGPKSIYPPSCEEQLVR